MEQPIFVLDQASFGYQSDQPLVQELNLLIYPRESVVILGANGSGKSTLLKLISGLLYLSRGRIAAFGTELNEKNLQMEDFNRAFRQKVGFVFQNSDAQLFSATVWDEVAFGPLQLGLNPEDVKLRVEETLALLGIANLATRPPYRLSGGEKKKVAIACVLAVNPEVLLLDEPTNGLDPRTQRWLVELLVSLRQAGKTIITATHDLSIVEEIADRVIIFNEAHQLAADGKPQELLLNRQLLLDVNLIHERSHFHILGQTSHAKHL
ncbi:MAG: ABC transporter ATP-binding protein [Peptococcaceae bacterium]|nr:ABC transporter ATP-binding protein [Peptococcaceae bacterium]